MTVLEEVEQQTGFKVMVFLGGLAPNMGKITSQMWVIHVSFISSSFSPTLFSYRTGVLIETKQTFNETYSEWDILRWTNYERHNFKLCTVS